ncbi:MAG: PAS domain-containing protein [Bacteroidota bacterium]|nr:MAG: PAS domain-containing protein [Bacteroidota bacterium]
MISLTYFSTLSFQFVIPFMTGALITALGIYLYLKYFKGPMGILRDLSELNPEETVPFITLLNNLPDSIFIKDPYGKYIVVNEKFASLLKKSSPKELIGKHDSDLYEESIAAKYNYEDQQILYNDVPELLREQRSENNGILKFTVTRKYPLKNRNGKLIGLLGIISDTTQQNLYNELLTQKNEEIEKERLLLRTLIDNMPDAIYIKDSECCFLDANIAQIEITKAKSRSEILGKSDFDYYPKEIADIFYKDDKFIMDTGQSVINKEEIGFDKEGNIRVRSTTKVPFKDENGKILGLVGIGRDITKLKETEEKLIEQAQNLQEVNVLLEERQEEINQQADELGEQNKILESERKLLRTLIDNLPDFVYIKDKNSTFITANQYMLDSLNIASEEEIKGKSDFDIYPKEMAKKFFSDDQRIISKGSPMIGIEETSLDKNGNLMYLLTSKVPYRNADGEIEGIVGIGKDITSLKETEIKLQEQADYLKEVNVVLEERQEEIQQQSSELATQNKIVENERNLLRVLIDNIPDSIYIKDTQSRFVLANKSLMEKLGINSSYELEGKSDLDFYPKDQAQRFIELEKQIIAQKKAVINKEELRVLDDGEKIFRTVTKVPYFDEDGRILGLVGITKDITELKNYQQQLEQQAEDLKEVNQLLEERSEEILKQSEWLEEQNKMIEKERSLLRTLIDNMPDFIYIKDAESRFITVNKRMLDTMQTDNLDDIIGKTDFDLAPSKEAAQEYFNDEVRIMRTGKAMINKEEIGFDEERREKVVSTTKVPFKDVDGKIMGIVGIGRDITKQKNTEKQLIEQAESLKEVNTLLEERQEKIQIQAEELNRQSDILKKTNARLEELNATKNKFFSIIAHDLKNPFQAIFGFSELLMRNFEDFEEKQRLDLLGMIKTSSESAYNLLENLLQWARTQTERIKYTPDHIQLHEIIQQIVILSTGNAEKKSIAIKTKMECSGKAWADFNMVNLIIRNLVSNAIKFTANNGIVTISCSDISQDKCLIAIRDTGIGISQENIKKLFRIDEYFSTTGTAGENGTGLGLIICKEFIEKNQGELMVDSELGKGTTFSFTLPRKEHSLG